MKLGERILDLFYNYNSLINEYYKQICIVYNNWLQIHSTLEWYNFRKLHDLSISLDVIVYSFWKLFEIVRKAVDIIAVDITATSFLIAFHTSAEVRSLWWQTLDLKNAHKRSQVDKYGDLGGHGISLFLETDNDPQSIIIKNHLVRNKHVHFYVVFSMWVELQHWLLTVSPFLSP